MELSRDKWTQTREIAPKASYPVTEPLVPEQVCYKIVDQRQSESAWVLFVQHAVTKKVFVLKILKGYQDETRYVLKERESRHKCLIECLRVNRNFVVPFSGIYKGLVRIIYPNSDHEDAYKALETYLSHLNVHRDILVISSLIVRPDLQDLDSSSEYALMMTRLEDNQRLDDLLYKARNDERLLSYYGEFLVEKVVTMHKRSQLPESPQTGLLWGSLKQLQEKLSGNFTFLKEALDRRKDLSREYGSWFEEQQELLPGMLEVYSSYFNDRLNYGYIRKCHGDLKTPNIWIAPHCDKGSGEVRDYVLLLDAIDFNPAFANIDVLSDFAMLVVDIQVRMGSEYLVDTMIENYLTSTRQQNAEARLVLNYYLIEKAMVGAAVSVIDDQSVHFSRAYLETAKLYTARFACEANRLPDGKNNQFAERVISLFQ